jgi:hypothetical protein
MEIKRSASSFPRIFSRINRVTVKTANFEHVLGAKE